MKTKFTGSVLVAALIFSGATALRAEARPLATTFRCVNQDRGFATIAQRGDRTTPPLIIWNTTLGKYNPKERCYMVSQRLTKVVGDNGGKLENMQLTTGTVNNQPVICAVNNGELGCNRHNVLFTLRPENAKKPNQVVATLKDFSVLGTGSAVNESVQTHTLALKKVDIWFSRYEARTNYSSKSPTAVSQSSSRRHGGI